MGHKRSSSPRLGSGGCGKCGTVTRELLWATPDEASRRLDESLRARSVNQPPTRPNSDSLAPSLSRILTASPFLTMKDMSYHPEPWVTPLEKAFEVMIPLTSKAGSGRGIHLPHSWSSSPPPLAIPLPPLPNLTKANGWWERRQDEDRFPYRLPRLQRGRHLSFNHGSKIRSACG